MRTPIDVLKHAVKGQFENLAPEVVITSLPLILRIANEILNKNTSATKCLKIIPETLVLPVGFILIKCDDFLGVGCSVGFRVNVHTLFAIARSILIIK